MSDLSRLLDDVYRSGPSTPAAPEWSSDSALDEAFSDWVAGESEGASEAEQEFAQLADPMPAPVPAPAPIPAETFAEMDELVHAAAAMAPAIDDDDDDVETAKEFASALAEPDTTRPVTVDTDALLRWVPERDLEVADPVSTVPTPAAWSRQDDDILPRRGMGGRRRGGLSLRRR